MSEIRSVFGGGGIGPLVVALVSMSGAAACVHPDEQGGADEAVRSSALVTAGFEDRAVLMGLTQPTAVKFAPDGKVFVAQKNGRIYVYDDVDDTSPTLFADLSVEVYDFWDRGLLGLAVDPAWPSMPFVYVLYTLDAASPGGVVPRWNDTCPTPPGATNDGCLGWGRLARLEARGDAVATSSRRRAARRSRGWRLALVADARLERRRRPVRARARGGRAHVRAGLPRARHEARPALHHERHLDAGVVAAASISATATAAATSAPGDARWPLRRGRERHAHGADAEPATASAGRYVAVTGAGTNAMDAPPADGRATWSFTVAEASRYRFWGRIINPHTGADSFWVRVDGGAWLKWNDQVPLGSEWHWSAVHDSGAAGAPVELTLAAGAHTLELAYRERGTKLDRLFITNGAGAP